MDSGADGEHAGRVAFDQRTGPLLWRALDAADRLDSLGTAGEVLRADFDMRRMQAELLLPFAVAAAVEPLTAAGLEPVIFKGPAVAQRYPSPGLRPMDDLDVLLPARQHEAALAVLLAAGWTRFEREGHHHDTVLFHPRVPHLALELHRGLDSWRDQSNQLSYSELWDRRQPIDCMGTQAFGVAPEDELVALAGHAGKPFHQFQRLIWSVDFAVLIEAASTGLDWDRVASLAERSSCNTVLAIALRHAERLGADVPIELLALPESRYRRAALSVLLEERWPLTEASMGEAHRLRYALCDDRARRVQLFVGEVTRMGMWRAPQQLVLVLALGVRRWRRWRKADLPVIADRDRAMHP